MKQSFLLALALLAGMFACSTPGGRIDQLYAELADEVARADRVKGPDPDIVKRHEERAQVVREMVKANELSSAKEYFEASVLLVHTNLPDDLRTSERLARKAAELGEPRGLRVAAEAIDKLAMITGKQQKYGTQYVYVAVLDSWRLYDCDVGTSDAERQTMGVPTYAEILMAEDELNRACGTKLRPR